MAGDAQVNFKICVLNFDLKKYRARIWRLKKNPAGLE